MTATLHTPEIIETLKKTAFVPLSDERFVTPNQAWIKTKFLRSILSDDCFPEGIYGSVDWIEFLCTLGLKQNIDQKTLIELAQYIENQFAKGKISKSKKKQNK